MYEEAEWAGTECGVAAPLWSLVYLGLTSEMIVVTLTEAEAEADCCKSAALVEHHSCLVGRVDVETAACSWGTGPSEGSIPSVDYNAAECLDLQ